MNLIAQTEWEEEKKLQVTWKLSKLKESKGADILIYININTILSQLICKHYVGNSDIFFHLGSRMYIIKIYILNDKHMQIEYCVKQKVHCRVR